MDLENFKIIEFEYRELNIVGQVSLMSAIKIFLIFTQLCRNLKYFYSNYIHNNLKYPTAFIQHYDKAKPNHISGDW